MKFTATIEIEIPEAEPGIPPAYWGAGFVNLYNLWNPLDLAKIEREVADCLTDEHHGVCEYEAARCFDGKVIP